MGLGLKTTTFVADEKLDWLWGNHGYDQMDTGTLYAPAFAAAYPTGIIKSGTPLGKFTTGAGIGMYGPYAPAAVDGTGDVAALLGTTKEIKGPHAGAVAQNTPCALFRHGFVVAAKLPTEVPIDANGKADLKLVVFL